VAEASKVSLFSYNGRFEFDYEHKALSNFTVKVTQLLFLAAFPKLNLDRALAFILKKIHAVNFMN